MNYFILAMVVISVINLIVGIACCVDDRKTRGYVPGDLIFGVIVGVIPIVNILFFLGLIGIFLHATFNENSRWFVKKVDKK